MSEANKSAAAGGEKTVELWTDGACKFNPGPGGWGAKLIYGAHTAELYGGSLMTTNNRMELTAVIVALGMLKRRCRIRLHTDSQYVKNGVEKWVGSWVKRGWKTSAGKPVKNVEYWKTLTGLTAKHDIEWVWVKGHAGIEGNEDADRLANWGVEAAKGERAPCAALRADVIALIPDEPLDE